MDIDLSPRTERTQAEIEAIVLAAVERFTDAGIATAFRSFVLAPRAEMRTWGWSRDLLEITTWVVAESARYDYGIVYAERGFGPAAPWGLVFSSQTTIGADYCWYESLETAFLDSRLIEEYRESTR